MESRSSSTVSCDSSLLLLSCAATTRHENQNEGGRLSTLATPGGLYTRDRGRVTAPLRRAMSHTPSRAPWRPTKAATGLQEAAGARV